MSSTGILFGLLFLVGVPGARAVSPVASEMLPRLQADTVALTGMWRAKATAPAWNGNFTMTLELEQLGDSLHGTYDLTYSGRVVASPVDISGHVNGQRIELHDRYDDFLLNARFDAAHLNGRLSHGSRERASAVPITFDRVRDSR